MVSLKLSIGVLVCALFVEFAQAKPSIREDVVPITKLKKPNSWYVQQAKAWKKEADNSHKNALAWRNYYFASRYANFGKQGIKGFNRSKREHLASIVKQMKKAVPDSYHTYYVQAYDTPVEKLELGLLKKAFKSCPDSSELWSSLILYHEIHGNHREKTKFCKMLYKKQDIERHHLDYNYNMLTTADDNSILFTNGDMDTYPAFMLQEAKGVRQDVTVLNLYLVEKCDGYLARKLKRKGISIDLAKLPKPQHAGDFLLKFCDAMAKGHPQVPIYFSVTVSNLDYLKGNLYNEGLAYRYSKQRIDNVGYIKKNLERKYRLDYLGHNWYGENEARKSYNMEINYIFPVLSLMRHYKAAEEKDRVKYWKNLARQIIERTGNSRTLKLLDGF